MLYFCHHISGQFFFSQWKLLPFESIIWGRKCERHVWYRDHSDRWSSNIRQVWIKLYQIWISHWSSKIIIIETRIPDNRIICGSDNRGRKFIRVSSTRVFRQISPFHSIHTHFSLDRFVSRNPFRPREFFHTRVRKFVSAATLSLPQLLHKRQLRVPISRQLVELIFPDVRA